jgi:hypothetical protein
VLRRGCVIGAGSLVRGEVAAYTSTPATRWSGSASGNDDARATVIGAAGFIGRRLVAHLRQRLGLPRPGARRRAFVAPRTSARSSTAPASPPTSHAGRTTRCAPTSAC